jgi:hypothetical protein
MHRVGACNHTVDSDRTRRVPRSAGRRLAETARRAPPFRRHVASPRLVVVAAPVKRRETELFGRASITQAYLTVSDVRGHLDVLVEARQITEDDTGTTTVFAVAWLNALPAPRGSHPH